jgi:hypothetical protein
MASKTVAAKSRKMSHKMSTTTEAQGKKTGCVQKKSAAAIVGEAQESDASGGKLNEPLTDATAFRAPARVIWDKYPERTEHLLDFLDAHPDVTIKLFGDSTKAAKSEGCIKMTAKSNKGATYLQVTDGIFSINEDKAVRNDFSVNPNKYAKVVNNYITNT